MDNKKVEYNPDEMWFDYQALFNKTKSVVLEQDCDIEVKHTNFESDKFARDATSIKNNNSELLNDIISGNAEKQCELLEIMDYYYQNDPVIDVYFSYEIFSKNYLFLLGIAASFCNLDDYYETVREKIIEYIGYWPDILKPRNVRKTNYYEVMELLSKANY